MQSIAKKFLVLFLKRPKFFIFLVFIHIIF